MQCDVIADAMGGVPQLASKTKLNATTLYRTLSKKGNPELRSMTSMLKAMGLRLAPDLAYVILEPSGPPIRPRPAAALLVPLAPWREWCFAQANSTAAVASGHHHRTPTRNTIGNPTARSTRQHGTPIDHRLVGLRPNPQSRHRRLDGRPHLLRLSVAGLQRRGRLLHEHRRRERLRLQTEGSDVGHTVRAVVTASNDVGSTSANSGLTGLVSAASSGPALFISPSGKDSSPCSQAQPCLTMSHAYEKASAGQAVQMLAGSYPGQTIPGASKAGSAHVLFAPAPGASVTVTGTIYVFGSHVTIEGMNVQDVTSGNYDQTPGRPNPTDVALLNLTGRNFEIDSATNVTVEGGSWGPASACGGPYGGNNNSIRQTIPAVTPENILINDTIIHDVQSYDLIECHIEGLAIFAGNHVTVSNSKFYGNSIYDVFMQANSGGKPNNVTIAKNWMANAVDNSAANGTRWATPTASRSGRRDRRKPDAGRKSPQRRVADGRRRD